jgi:hypothetical protein
MLIFNGQETIDEFITSFTQRHEPGERRILHMLMSYLCITPAIQRSLTSRLAHDTDFHFCVGMIVNVSEHNCKSAEIAINSQETKALTKTIKMSRDLTFYQRHHEAQVVTRATIGG